MPELSDTGEAAIRLGFFLGILVLVALWEAARPRRRLTHPRWLRWYANLGLAAFNTALVWLLVPLAPVALAVIAESRGWGLLNLVELPFWLEVLLAVIVLDFAIYLQHVVFHAVPALWRLHRMHHADLDFDVTTGARFHPVEILLSVAIKLAAVALIGAPAAAVLIFEILLNATSMFNHGNLRMPAWLDRMLRWIVVTPDMHRVHHSDIPAETDSNFGFNLPWWDRLFGTYRAQPRLGHEGMTIGLDRFRQREDLHLHRMLLQPLRRGEKSASTDRRRDRDGPA
ncbi:MAG: sterol desaturase family protein [Alphaproteobacteria bacterium]|nr:sterol desaturase family protein [Alphaproteobacteria bacterium]